jgi:Rrf2 family protein
MSMKKQPHLGQHSSYGLDRPERRGQSGRMLSSKGKYAVRAATMLAERFAAGEWVPTVEIAETEHIPRKFLETILVNLRDHGLVDSRRGSHGGHQLSRDPARFRWPRSSA